jgi:hypothetical protein
VMPHIKGILSMMPSLSICLQKSKLDSRIKIYIRFTAIKNAGILCHKLGQ